MSSSARKKEKHRLKRKEKKHRLQRMNSRTALQRIAAEGGELECWITPDWKEQGIASIQVLGRAPGGHGAFAAFLVDLWAVGLKDAFGRSDVPWLDFREGNLEPAVEKSGSVKLDPAVARRLVAGAVRFGRQNSFRMPPQWEKFVVIFGRAILDEIPTADISDFGIDGGIRYMGTTEFLKTRLNVSPDEFLARPDVHWVMGPDPRVSGSIGEADLTAESPNEEDVESLQAVFNVTRQGASQIAEQVQQWCTAHGVEQIPHLEEATNLLMFSMLPSTISKEEEEGDEPTKADIQQGQDLMNMMLAQKPAAEREALMASFARLRDVVDKMVNADSSGQPDLHARLPEELNVPAPAASQEA